MSTTMKTFILLASFALVCLVASLPLDDGSSRIVNGEKAEEGAYPWQGSLRYQQSGKWSHICGVSLIDAYTVITAAHCVDFADASKFRVLLGAHDFRYPKAHEQTIGVSRMAKHPDWTPDGRKGFPNDVAVLKLSERANIEHDFIEPIEPYMGDDPFTYHKCYISGWGKTSGTSGAANVLKVAHKLIIRNSECRARWNAYRTGLIHAFHICPYEPDVSACSGDSGGPMSCLYTDPVTRVKKWYVVGITSWGMRSCDGRYPSVYTRVSYYKDFITKNRAA